MDEHRDWITIEEIARLEGSNYQTTKKRLQRAHATYKHDDTHAQRRLYALTCLSPEARNQWLSEQVQVPAEPQIAPITPIGQATQIVAGAHGEMTTALKQNPESVAPYVGPQVVHPLANPPQSLPLAAERGSALQPILPFAPPSPSQAARDQAVAAIPTKEQKYVDCWMSVLADHLNGTWKIYQGQEYGGFAITKREDFLRAQAHLQGVSERSVYTKLQIARRIIKDKDIPAPRKWTIIAESLRPKNRPGRSSAAFFAQPENAWMWPELRRIYLNQAQLSKEASFHILIDLIERKQAAHGIDHFYHKPSKWQVFAALEKISAPERVLGRQGEKVFDDQCGMYISRDPSTLHANDLWVTDQREVDVRLRDGGEHLGRIWMVSFLDVASDKILGYAFGPILSSDMVMTAATMAIALNGVPKAVHMDLGKEFICQAFNGSVRKFSGETLYREAKGLWGSLGVKIVKAIGRNPKSKTIERWHEQVTQQFDKRFPGYCGSNTDERPEKLYDEERLHLEWLGAQPRVAVPHKPLVTMGQYIQAFMRWAEEEWNAGARGRGKMRLGMTPNEAFNVKRPATGFKFIGSGELDHHSADHRFGKIARGGQVNLTFFGQTLEYEAAELFLHQGEDAEFIISRRTFRQVTVIYPVIGGTATCVATLKPQLDWLPENRDELRAAMRCKAAVHRAIRQGVKASRVALEAANPVEMLEQQKALPAKDIIGAQKFFAEPTVDSRQSTGDPTDHPSIGSVEWMATRRHSARPTSEDVAKGMFDLEG